MERGRVYPPQTSNSLRPTDGLTVVFFPSFSLSLSLRIFLKLQALLRCSQPKQLLS
ncbi:hypothetical protein OAV88_02635 [bacterium]|nr:hypothetical protein [bacterium]